MEIGPSRSYSLTPRIVSAVFLVVGLILSVIAVVAGVHQADFQSHSLTAPGKVVRMESRQSCTSKKGCTTSDYPVIQFEAGGKTVTYTENTSGASAPHPGDAVTVRYDPANPQDAQLDSFISAWLLTIATGSLAVVFVGIGVGGVIHYRKRS